MSISLSDHEQRIKVLENGDKYAMSSQLLNTTKSGNLTTLYNISNYNFLIFWIITGNVCYGVYWIPYLDFKTSGVSFEIGGVSSSVEFKYVNDTTVWKEPINGISWLIKLWGLKIYYIFRYNIHKMLKLISPILKF